VIVSKKKRWLFGSACAVLAVLALVIAVTLPAGPPGPPPGGFAGTATVRQDAAWNQLFQGYGNLSGQWSGGDGAQALPLPDGGTIWFFADTYLGATDPSGARAPLTTGVAHNSAVLYRGGHLGPTYAQAPALGGYTSAGDYTWVTPPPPYPASRYELINGDQLIDGGAAAAGPGRSGTVYKFYQLADRDLSPGGFAYKLVGTVVEAFSLDSASDTLTPAGGAPIGIQDTATSDPVIWGAATLISGGYIYIYGVRPYHGSRSPYPLYLARVPVGGLATGEPWQYYRGAPGCSVSSTMWTSDPASASALRTGVSAGFSVTDVNGTYVLLTSDNSTAHTTNNAVAYYAGCPTGFAPDSPRYRVYQPRLPSGYLTYEYRIVPQFSSGSDVLVSYSTNTTRANENFYNAAIYRPRFLDVKLPGITGPAGPITEPSP
jgi:hypothetical protein